MSSPGNPTVGPDEPPQVPIYVPEGPMWHAWIAPDGGGVKLSVLAMKREARWLRRAQPRPFGFAPSSAHPAPERIRDAHGAGTVSSSVASLLGLRTAVWTMSIRYGDVAAPLAPAAEIISDFHREYQDRDLEEALLEAAGKWPRRAQAADAVAGDGRAGGSRADVTSATIDVVLSGRRRPASMLRLAEFSAFQVSDEGVLVTVLARNFESELPDILRLDDLEPMLSVLEHPDKEVIAAALGEQRRQHIEQMRNQARPNS